MGVLPLQFNEGESAAALGLTGQERFEISGFDGADAVAATVVATPAAGSPVRFKARVRIDTPKEREYFQHGGILQYVLRQLAGQSRAA
jgi:aconitate hydratase